MMGLGIAQDFASLNSSARAFVSRASTATYIDANGVLQTAGVNVPRYQGGALLVEGAATNLLENGDVETGTAGWGEGSGVNSIARDNTVAFHGTYSVKYTKTAAPTGGPYWRNVDNTVIAASANADYTLSFYVYANAGSVGMSFNPRTEWYNSSGVNTGISTGPAVALVLGWQRIVLSAISPPGTASVVPTCYEYGSNPLTNWSVWFDCVQFESGDVESSVIPTNGAPATRAADIVAFV